MNNRFIPDAVKIVQQAVEADKKEDFQTAYGLYKQALERFMLGLKYEKNKTSIEIIKQRVVEYMNRAEQLKELLEGNASPKRVVASAGGGPVKKAGPSGGGGDGGGDGKPEDEDAAKMKGALAGAIVTEKPNVKWDDVAGLEGAKEALKEAVILPARFPQLFTGKRRPWKGILLYGPPGTGKSYLAKAVATEADSTFFSVSSSDLVSKYLGESERLVRNLFEMARDRCPAIIFIDEIDSLCTSRSDGESESSRRIKTEFLVQMQGVGKTHDGILVLGATNTPWEIDSAMRRRFEKRVYIPLPETHARATIFKIHLGDTKNNLSDEDFEELGRRTAGFSGSDVSVVVREALMEPLRMCRTAKFFRPEPDTGLLFPVVKDPPCPRCPIVLSGQTPSKDPCRSCGAIRTTLYEIPSEKLKVPDVTMDHFLAVVGHTNSSVGPDELKRYVDWTAEFGEEGV